ncbi:MAG: FtsQ-type POTRA domain-containing protein [Clostridia bacterium]|nr:FtsQ-type POTRA domain-containing protein [Clostridia bacterium]
MMTRMQKGFLAFIITMLVVSLGYLILKNNFTVTNVIVEGSEHYTDDEIKALILDDKFGNNSIYYYFKYYNNEVEDIPFIEKIEIDLPSTDTIKIHVYEKAVAGYVEFLGRYLYFDKDGIVVESSLSQMEGIPYVTGLHFEHVVLHEKLPVEDDQIFKLILNLTQLLTKYSIATDRIYFDSDYNITLYFGQTQIYLGPNKDIDEKINTLQSILPKMNGRKGVLHMENYDGENGKFTFQLDDNE